LFYLKEQLLGALVPGVQHIHTMTLRRVQFDLDITLCVVCTVAEVQEMFYTLRDAAFAYSPPPSRLKPTMLGPLYVFVCFFDI